MVDSTSCRTARRDRSPSTSARRRQTRIAAMIEIRTERLLLRRARESDLEGIHAVLSDARATHYWSAPPHTTVEQTKTWLQSMIEAPPEESDDFVVTLAGAVIGKLGAWRLPEVGYILRSDHWGRGFAREAMSAFLRHAFETREVPELIADVDPRNIPSLKLLAAAGFVETGRATGTWTTHIGVCDSIYLKLRREEWLASSS